MQHSHPQSLSPAALAKPKDPDCCATMASPARDPDCTMPEHGAAAAASASAGVHTHALHGQHGLHGKHGGATPSLARLTTSATIHCLSGCAIGEFAGLAIGVTLGFNPWATMALATVLGFASGYALGLRPLLQQGMRWGQAFKTIWLGETISIAFMEFAMNFTDYHVGGVQAASMLAPKFWIGYALALPAGFIVAWPVNWWLLRRSIKQPCH